MAHGAMTRAAATILMPAGFFHRLAHGAPSAPHGAIQFVYLGAVILSISVLILGVGFVRAGVYGYH